MTESEWSPRADINETDEEIIIDMELPGNDKKDITVDVSNNTLVVTGERKQEKNRKTPKAAESSVITGNSSVRSVYRKVSIRILSKLNTKEEF